MICYPQGLPEWDFVRQCLEEREDLTGTNVSRDGCICVTLSSWYKHPWCWLHCAASSWGIVRRSGRQLLSLLVLADGVHSMAAWWLRSPCKYQWLQVSIDLATT
jgi:hypothetical protein